MPKWQRADDVRLNVQPGKGRGGEIQTNVYVVVLIEITANEEWFTDLEVHCDDDIATYCSFELPLDSTKFELCYRAIMIFVKVNKLFRVLDCQCQRRL